jgi:hypothetical protein
VDLVRTRIDDGRSALHPRGVATRRVGRRADDET